MRVVDLSAPLGESTVMWPGDVAPSAVVVESYEREGSLSRRVTLSEHSGTHFDAPCHFSNSGASVADVPLDQLVRPLHIIDIAERAASDPDTVLTAADIALHEAAHGVIAEGDAVFLRTGWDRRRDDPSAYFGRPDELHFPGFGVSAAQMLVSERAVSGIGIDTLGIDAGTAPHFPVHATVTLPNGVWHVENLINLHAVPVVGATVVIGVPRLVGGSGFPARVLALLPD